MATRLSLTAVFEAVEGGWVQGRIEEFPGVITAAPSLAEAKELLVDALGEFLLTQGSREHSRSQETPPSANRSMS